VGRIFQGGRRSQRAAGRAYNDDVIEFSFRRAQSESAIFQVAIGKQAKRILEIY
jgi:hypothetical protein